MYSANIVVSLFCTYVKKEHENNCKYGMPWKFPPNATIKSIALMIWSHIKDGVDLFI